jgi:hypothetical protein
MFSELAKEIGKVFAVTEGWGSSRRSKETVSMVT